MSTVLVLKFDSLLQSFGCHSKDRRRDTSCLPTKSQVQGMLANAMGHDKWSTDRISVGLAEELASNIRFAVRDDSKYNCYRMTDFCIARRENKDNDILYKEYLVQPSYTVFLEGESSYIKNIARFLSQPRRQLYIGRKCCTLEKPVAWDEKNKCPNIIENSRIESLIFKDYVTFKNLPPHIIECNKNWANFKRKSLSKEATSLLDTALTARWKPVFGIQPKSVALQFGNQIWGDLLYYSVKLLKYGDMEEV